MLLYFIYCLLALLIKYILMLFSPNPNTYQPSHFLTHPLSCSFFLSVKKKNKIKCKRQRSTHKKNDKTKTNTQIKTKKQTHEHL